MTNRPDVSVVMVSYNTRELLAQSLASLFAQTPSLNLQVTVIDNASSDGSAEMVRESFPRVKLVANFENLGITKANNQGLKVSNGRYILLLNPDTIILDRAIERMRAFLGSHPEIGACGCKLLNPDGSYQRSDFPPPSLISAFYLYSSLFARFPALGQRLLPEAVNLRPDKTRPVQLCATTCFLISRACLNDVGYLDERFFLYSEDYDLCLRIWQKGWKVYYLPEASITHYEGASMNSGAVTLKRNFSRMKRRQTILRGELILLRKWHGGLYARLYYTIVWILALFGWCRVTLKKYLDREKAVFWDGEAGFYKSVITNSFHY